MRMGLPAGRQVAGVIHLPELEATALSQMIGDVLIVHGNKPAPFTRAF